MPSTTVRISPHALKVLKELAEEMHESMQAILEQAVENYRRAKFLEVSNAAFAALRINEKAWKEELKEREAWDASLSDGLESE